MLGGRGEVEASERNRYLEAVGPSKYSETVRVLLGLEAIFPCYRVSF